MGKLLPKILFITNMYPYPKFIYMGMHVKEQIDCLVENFGINAKTYFINAKEHGKFEYIKSIFKIIHILRKDKEIKVVHIHYGLSALFLLFFKPKAKVFITFHGGDILKEQGFYIQVMISKYIAKKVDKVFILNEEMEKIMKRLNVCYEILPCGVNADFFIENDKKDSSDKNLRTILFPGDPNRTVKNYPLFKKVIEIISTKSKFNIKYECLHNMTRTEIREALSQADCLIMTSFSEGSPQVIKEALACNLSVISVPVGDVATVIENIPSCFIANGYNANELADLTIHTLDNVSSLIRDEFLKKGKYENKSICHKLLQNYVEQ